MTKVLQIVPSLDTINGGVERGTLDVAKKLIEKGFHSEIISSGGLMAEKYKYKGVNHNEIEINKKGLINLLMVRRKFEKMLNEIKPDIVHIRSRWPALCFNQIVKKKKIPLVTTYHGTYSGNDFFLKKNYNRVMTGGDKIITISSFIDKHVRHYFPEVKNRLCQIDRGIDLNYFSINAVTQTRKEVFLNSFSIAENTHIILLPARISMWKGHFVAVDAAKELKERYPELNFVFLFVGGSNKTKFFERLKKRVKRNRVEEKIIFAGNVSDMPAIYSIADVVLSTSIEPEAFGRVSAEGCSMSKPVISSNHGGSKDIIENEKTGWLVEPGNPTKLAEKIIQVINMPERKKDQIVRSARVRVQKKFSLDQMLNKTINLYEELVARRENINY